MKNILLINELKSRLPSNLYTELVMSKRLEELDDAQSSQLVADASYMKKPTLVWVFALLFGCFGGHCFYSAYVFGICRSRSSSRLRHRQFIYAYFVSRDHRRRAAI